MVGEPQSDEPQGNALAALMANTHHSSRSLGKLARLAHGTINNARNGTDPIGADALVRVALAVGYSPRYFADVRLEAVRQLLDPGDMPSALRYLAIFEEALAAHGLAPVDFGEPTPESLEQLGEQLDQEVAQREQTNAETDRTARDPADSGRKSARRRKGQ